MAKATCLEDGCDDPVGRGGAKGKCRKHYLRDHVRRDDGLLDEPADGWPGSDDLCALVRETGSASAAARALGIKPRKLRDYTDKVPGLTARLKAARPAAQTTAAMSAKYRAAHLAKRRAADLEHYYKNRPTRAATNKRWHENNRARHRVRKQAELDQNRDAINASRRNRRTANPELFRARARDYHAKRKGGGPEAVEYARVLRGDPCSYCGALADRPQEVDHIVAVARGGGNEWANLTAACNRCNTSKQDIDVLSFMLRRLDAV